MIPGPDESATGTRHHGSHALTHVPDLLLARRGSEGDDLMGFNIHVQQAVAMPDGAFAPDGNVFGDEFRIHGVGNRAGRLGIVMKASAR